jgi:lipopolysaccharide transport system permease protein
MRDPVTDSQHELIIEPHAGMSPIDLHELWRFRELFYMLAWREIKVRYKQTVLGTAWAVFQPVITMIVFTLFFGVLIRVPSDNVPYPIFVYAGLLPWTFFSNGISRASNSLLGDANMISKVYFPRVIVPISSFGAGVLDLAISFIIMLVMMLHYGVYPGLSVLLFAPLLLITFLVAVGVGTWLSALSVAYRDVKYITPFLIQLWMYSTPVIYPVSVVPEKWRWVLSLNPMAGLIDGCRSALFGKPFAWGNIAISILMSFGLAVFGLLYFKRFERNFVDII